MRGGSEISPTHSHISSGPEPNRQYAIIPVQCHNLKGSNLQKLSVNRREKQAKALLFQN